MSRARVQWTDRFRQVREFRLDGRAEPVRVGRDPRCEVCIDAPSVSRHHMLLTPVGDTWFAENVSKLGTLLDAAPLAGRHALAHGDRLVLGRVTLTFKDEDEPSQAGTVPVAEHGPRSALTSKEREVLATLCGPVVAHRGPPASNAEIAESLTLTIDGVRSHLRAIYAKFDLVAGTAAQRRAALVQRAIDSGLITPP